LALPIGTIILGKTNCRICKRPLTKENIRVVWKSWLRKPPMKRRFWRRKIRREAEMSKTRQKRALGASQRRRLEVLIQEYWTRQYEVMRPFLFPLS
jgi:hypothetical protein